LFQATLLYN